MIGFLGMVDSCDIRMAYVSKTSGRGESSCGKTGLSEFSLVSLNAHNITSFENMK